jgi:hypothetical protein
LSEKLKMSPRYLSKLTIIDARQTSSAERMQDSSRERHRCKTKWFLVEAFFLDKSGSNVFDFGEVKWTQSNILHSQTFVQISLTNYLQVNV